MLVAVPVRARLAAHGAMCALPPPKARGLQRCHLRHRQGLWITINYSILGNRQTNYFCTCTYYDFSTRGTIAFYQHFWNERINCTDFNPPCEYLVAGSACGDGNGRIGHGCAAVNASGPGQDGAGTGGHTPGRRPAYRVCALQPGTSPLFLLMVLLVPYY